MSKSDNGARLAIGVAGLLAAAGMIRKVGNQASGSRKKGSAAIKEIRTHKSRGGKLKAEWHGSLPPDLTFSTSIGIFDHLGREKSSAKANSVFKYSVEDGQGIMLRSLSSRSPTYQGSAELLENHIVYSGIAMWADDGGPRLTQGEWRRSKSLDELRSKVTTLALLEKSWDRLYKDVPVLANPPFDLSGGLIAWFHALSAFDTYPSTSAVADSSWSDTPDDNSLHTKDRNFRSDLRTGSGGQRGKVLWFARKLDPDMEEHEQQWNLWINTSGGINPPKDGYYQRVYLGSDPLKIYDALRLFEKEIKDSDGIRVFLEYSYVTKRWGHPPSMDDKPLRVYAVDGTVRHLSDPTVSMIQQDLLKMAQRMDENHRFSDGKTQDRLRTDVIPFLANSHAHDDWFQKIDPWFRKRNQQP